MYVDQSWLDPEADPELDFGVMGPLMSFSCQKFLNTIVCYRKYCRLGGPWPPGSAPDLTSICNAGIRLSTALVA